MATYWYLPGAEGMRYCWARDPTFECPHSLSRWDQIDLATGDVVAANVVREPGERMGITFRRHISAEIAQAAKILHVDAEKLAHLLVRPHAHGTKRMRVNGKLTSRCDHCGATMTRLGFRCWIERPVTDEEAREPGAQITAAMGSTPTKTVKSFYLDTKREAETWAREEAKISKEGAIDVN